MTIDPLFFDYFKNKNEKTKTQLIHKNYGLVIYVVNKLYNKTKVHKLHKEDLIQEGILGLDEAIKHFDPEKGFQFSTYALWWIRQSCNLYLSEKISNLVVPANIRSMHKEARKVAKTLDMPIGSSEVQKALNLDNKAFRKITQAEYSTKCSSLDEYYTEDQEKTNNNKFSVMSFLSTEAIEDQDSTANQEKIYKAVSDSIKQLSVKHRVTIMHRYGIKV